MSSKRLSFDGNVTSRLPFQDTWICNYWARLLVIWRIYFEKCLLIQSQHVSRVQEDRVPVNATKLSFGLQKLISEAISVTNTTWIKSDKRISLRLLRKRSQYICTFWTFRLKANATNTFNIDWTCEYKLWFAPRRVSRRKYLCQGLCTVSTQTLTKLVNENTYRERYDRSYVTCCLFLVHLYSPYIILRLSENTESNFRKWLDR